ncbi:MBL fold metallo-hydrolase [Halostella litorea]|uniref:MBL fold metallo-hydrolase n=1 Tax=Halostella litorea TaxID=2528831 RepID=UPI0010927386|nr:rhodanese-like domain-containing protein [Halostella litorea]
MVDQMTASELAERLDAGEPLTLVDTRPSDSFDGWHIAGAENVPYDPREGIDDEAFDRIRDVAGDGPVTTICGKGLTSTSFAFELEERGIDDVTVVKGGMEEWSRVYDAVPIETSTDDLVVRQIQRRGKGCLGYVVGSKGTGEAAVFDATRQTDTFAVAAESAGLTIDAVFDTHVHADHISGGPSLAATVDAPYYLGDAATDRDVEYDYEPVADGDVLTVGDVEIRAIHAPGHTGEMMNYRVADELLLTGDTLFVESVGRTELQFGEADAARGAELLYGTLHERLLESSDDTTVLPGHVSVSAGGQFKHGTPGEPIAASLGNLRESLDLLGLEKKAFVDRLTDDVPEKPPNYEQIIAINTGRASPDSEGEATELELGPNNCAA